MLNNLNLSSINFKSIVFFIILIAVIIVISKVVGFVGRIIGTVIVIFVIVYFLQNYGIKVPYLGDIVNQIYSYIKPIITNVTNLIRKFK
jgi:hypothetical protein